MEFLVRAKVIPGFFSGPAQLVPRLFHTDTKWWTSYLPSYVAIQYSLLLLYVLSLIGVNCKLDKDLSVR